MRRAPLSVWRAATGCHHGRSCDVARLGRRLIHGLAQRESLPSEQPPVRASASQPGPRLPELSNARLSYEAEVDAPDGGVRLVDSEDFKHNHVLWLKLLRHRAKERGATGVLQIFRGMKARNVQLPTRGPVGDEFWSRLGNFISPSALFRYALKLHRQSGSSWPGLYPLILRHVLEHRPTEALDWAKRMQALDLRGAALLHTLIPSAVRSKRALRAFRELHRLDKDARIYAKLIPALCKRKMLAEALSWHKRLVSHQDVPASIDAASPLIELLKREGRDDADSVIEDLEKAGVTACGGVSELPKTNKPQALVVADEFVQDPDSDALGPSPRTISDKFAARAFATRMWSLDTIINGLTYFGLTELGPLAVRELAARCPAADELARRFEQIDDKRVATVDCVFTGLVRLLARDGNQAMLEAVVNSDMHPDVYDDAATQWKLLEYYRARRDEAQAQRTLVILNFHERRDAASAGRASDRGMTDGPNAYAWNTAVAEDIRDGRWDAVYSAVDQMIQLGVGVQQMVVRASWEVFEKQRPARAEEALLVTNLWLKVMRSGAWIAPFFWHRPIDFLGREGRLEEMERVCLWVSSWYAQRARTKRGQLTWLRTIFTTTRVKRMVVWGFQTLDRPGPRPTRRVVSLLATDTDPHRWLLGLRVVKALRGYGVRAPTLLVRRVCLLRLTQLFDDRRQSRERRNRVAKGRNPHSLVEMVAAINEAWQSDSKWGRPPFELPAEVMGDERLLKQRLILKDELKEGVMGQGGGSWGSHGAASSPAPVDR